jgi:hypothetical protein
MLTINYCVFTDQKVAMPESNDYSVFCLSYTFKLNAMASLEGKALTLLIAAFSNEIALIQCPMPLQVRASVCLPWECCDIFVLHYLILRA